MAWKLLLSKYKLHVYPIHFGGLRNGEAVSIDFFSHVFKSEHPQQFHSPVIVPFQTPLLQDLKSILMKNSAEHIFDLLSRQISKEHPDLSGATMIPGLFTYFYSVYLRYAHSLQVSTVFTGVNLSDGELIKTQTKTFLKVMELFLVIWSQNKDFQFTGVFTEPKLSLLNKVEVVQLGIKMGLALEKTYSSCLSSSSSRLQCGTCYMCHVRRSMFANAGIDDATPYAYQLNPLQRWCVSQESRLRGFYIRKKYKL